MKITFVDEPELITVAFSDSDDGKAVERLVATSALEPGSAATLGRVFSVSSLVASCREVDGRLDLVHVP
jgi:hypothetical protein